MGRINSIGSWFEKNLSGFTFGIQDEKIIVKGTIEMEASLTTGFTQTFQDKSGVVAHIGDLNHLTGATFNTTDGILTLSGLTGSTITVDLDGRYVQSGDFDGNYLPLSGGTMDNTTLVTNLNAQYLDSLDSSFYSLTGHTHVLSAITDVTATATELNILDLSETALTVGWGYLADGSSAASWRQLLGSEINNDLGWTTSATTVTSVTGGYGIASTGGLTPDISLDLNELSVSAMTGGDWIAFDDAGTSNKALISTIDLGIFNNDQNWSSTVGTVTSVALSAETGFTIVGSPITTSGTIGINFSTGYSLPTTDSQAEWTNAYNNMVTGVSFDANGHLTITALTGATYVTSLDGRYLALTGGTMSNTNLVPNLNADLLDSQEGSYYLDYGNVTSKPGIFEIIAVPGQANVVADSPTDTLSFSGGTNVTITTDAGSDSLTINSTHPNISAAGSEDNSGRVYIQDITVDSNGHITAMATATEVGEGSNYIYDGSFNTTDGVLTLTGLTGNTVTVDLDGRYELSGVTTSLISVAPTGAIDGVNQLFTIPDEPANIILTVDGVVRHDFSLSGTNITIDFAPLTGSVVWVYYNVGGFSSTSPLTTKGDLYTFDTSNQRLVVGTDGYTLVADSTEPTGLKWEAGGSSSMSGLTDTIFGSVVKGDVLVWSGGSWTNLGVGADNQILMSDSSEVTGVKWNTGSVGTGTTVVHTQSSSATTWSFAHNLGTMYPVFNVWDEDNKWIGPLGVEAIDADNAEITFSIARTGWVSAVVGGVSAPVLTLSALTDTQLSATTNESVLKYSASSQKWEAGTAGGGALSALTDTNIGTPSDGQSLIWDDAASEWAPNTPAGGGNVSNTGTPVDNQVAIWKTATTIDGTINLTFDDTTNILTVGEDDVDNGVIKVFGGNSTTGGQLWLYNGANGDTTDDYYYVQGANGGFYIGGDSTGDFLAYTTSDDTIRMANGNLYIGVNDTTKGNLYIYGDSGSNGGELRIYNGATTDTNSDYYRIRGNSDQFDMLSGVGEEFFSYDSAGTNITMAQGNLLVGINDSNPGLIDLYGNNINGTGGKLRLWNAGNTDTDDNYYNIDALSGVLTFNGNLTGNFLTYTSSSQVVGTFGAITSDQTVANQVDTGASALITQQFGDARYASSGITNTLSGLTDTTFGITPIDGEVLTWNDSASSWSASTGGSGSATILDDNAPTLVVGGTWFQPTEGKLHVGVDDSWVDVAGGLIGPQGPPTVALSESGTTLSLTTTAGAYYNMSDANSATTYTTSGTVVGSFACVLINTTSQPTVTGGTLIPGSSWVTGTDMHLWVQYFGVTVQYYFAKLV